MENQSPTCPRSRCLAEIARIEALDWADLSAEEALGACIGWLDWNAELLEEDRQQNQSNTDES